MNKTANNYDKSSNGTDIESTCFYDTDTSQREFDENFKVLQHQGYRTHTVAYYVDGGNVPDDSAISFTVKGNKKDLIKFLLSEGRNYSESEVKKMKKAELQESAYDALAYYEGIGLLNWEKISLADTGLELVPSKNLVKVAIRGYCQGDYAEVYYCPDDLEKAWGKAPTESALKETFAHLFFDAPVYASVTVNGEEYFYHDMPEYDEYEWKRDQFLDYVAKESGVPVETLGAVLPKEPTY